MWREGGSNVVALDRYERFRLRSRVHCELSLMSWLLLLLSCEHDHRPSPSCAAPSLPYLGTSACPADSCVSVCGTRDSKATCCRSTHSTETYADTKGLIRCLAQAYGMPPGKEECMVAQLESPAWEHPWWVAASTTENECDAPNHSAGFYYYFDPASFELAYILPWTGYSLGECEE